ncbi:hypothetical protein C4D60_Mb09t16090 [Musa balbisiana]|uniref:Exportin-1 C-terminal domain-containing protein n=1 Tax=Musa balbisiana TaxID=52838 RepID=A0A4S8IGV9_MUSBA|nr:hypothetical protein C4D60_Mb09t16090 [Musa balbisiana]
MELWRRKRRKRRACTREKHWRTCERYPTAMAVASWFGLVYPKRHDVSSRGALFLFQGICQMFTNLRIQMLASQPMDQQQHLSLCFEKLMADVTRSLDSKNRDKFTQNLTIFRREFRV